MPEGDISLWQTDPFEPVIKEGKIYGRGSEDNGQSIVSSLFAAKAIAKLDLTPKYTLCLAFVSDEETWVQKFSKVNSLFTPPCSRNKFTTNT